MAAWRPGGRSCFAGDTRHPPQHTAMGCPPETSGTVPHTTPGSQRRGGNPCAGFLPSQGPWSPFCVRKSWPHSAVSLCASEASSPIAVTHPEPVCGLTRPCTRCFPGGGPLMSFPRRPPAGMSTLRPSCPSCSQDIPFLNALQLRPLARRRPAAPAAPKASPGDGPGRGQDPGQRLLPEQLDFGFSLYDSGQAGRVTVQGLMHLGFHAKNRIPGSI